MYVYGFSYNTDRNNFEHNRLLKASSMHASIIGIGFRNDQCNLLVIISQFAC